MPDELKTAEELIESHPDSALKILRGVRTIQLINPSDKALYALLLSSALDKNDIKIESDSIISIATNYYDSKQPDRAGYAWFYHSRCANNRNNAEIRASSLFKAQEYAEKTKNYRLQGLIYGDKAEMYRSQQQFDSSLTLEKKALNAFKMVHNHYNSSLSAYTIANEYRGRRKFDSSLYYMNLANNLAKPLKDTVLTATIQMGFGGLYLVQRKIKNALYHYQKAPITHINEYDYNKWYLIGKTFNELNQLDSAKFYLNKVKHTYKFGVDYYTVWESVYEKQKNYKMSLFYYRKLIQNKDSLRQISLENSFAGLEKKYDYEHLSVENKTLIIENKQRGIIVLFSLLVISIFVLILLYWRFESSRRQLKAQQELNEKEKAILEKERENNFLLQRQTKMQNILLQNVEQYRVQSLKAVHNLIGSGSAPLSTMQEAIIIHADEVHNNISKRLAEKYPQLTDRDILICCMILLDFATGMIATLLNVRNDSINTHRTRLRKKLFLESNENLVEFLHRF